MPDELKDGKLTPEEKIAIVIAKPQVVEAMAELVEAIIPAKVESIAENRICQSWNFHCYGKDGAIDGPAIVGDKYEVILLKNGQEVGHIIHSVIETIPEGMEMRPFIQYFPTICAKIVKSEPIKP